MAQHKMVDRNPHTGEKLQSKANSDAYRNNFDSIFGKKSKVIAVDETVDKSSEQPETNTESNK